MRQTGGRWLAPASCAIVAGAALACAGVASRSSLDMTRVETSCGGEKRVDRILVAYASKHGATAEIATRVGEVLCQAGLATDVEPADRVKGLTTYRAVVLGSAVYVGHWRKEAATFLKANEKALAARPVWLFSSGPTGEGDALKLTKGWRFPEDLASVAGRIQPRGIVVFHGKVDPAKLGFVEKAMLKHVDAPVGDFRDWPAIASWAASIADTLQTASTSAAVR